MLCWNMLGCNEGDLMILCAQQKCLPNDQLYETMLEDDIHNMKYTIVKHNLIASVAISRSGFLPHALYSLF